MFNTKSGRLRRPPVWFIVGPCHLSEQRVLEINFQPTLAVLLYFIILLLFLLLLPNDSDDEDGDDDDDGDGPDDGDEADMGQGVDGDAMEEVGKHLRVV